MNVSRDIAWFDANEFMFVGGFSITVQLLIVKEPQFIASIKYLELCDVDGDIISRWIRLNKREFKNVNNGTKTLKAFSGLEELTLVSPILTSRDFLNPNASRAALDQAVIKLKAMFEDFAHDEPGRLVPRISWIERGNWSPCRRKGVATTQIGYSGRCQYMPELFPNSKFHWTRHPEQLELELVGPGCNCARRAMTPETW